MRTSTSCLDGYIKQEPSAFLAGVKLSRWHVAGAQLAQRQCRTSSFNKDWWLAIPPPPPPPPPSGAQGDERAADTPISIPPPPPPPPHSSAMPQWWGGTQQKGVQNQPSYDQLPSMVARDMVMDSGNKWKWPSLDKWNNKQGSRWDKLSGGKTIARRLYNNQQLQDLVRKEQEASEQKRAGIPQQQAVPPDLNEMPTPPGFFSSGDEAKQFMDWMTNKRAQRMQDMERSHDREIAGIAGIYLVAATFIIILGLAAAL